jgi:hypothetical protein
MINGEHGLPQTVFVMAKDVPVRGVFMKNWLPINAPLDIKRAESFLTHSREVEYERDK